MAMLSAALLLAGLGLAFAHRLVRGFDLRRHRFDLFGRDILGTRTSAAVRAPSSNPSAVRSYEAVGFRSLGDYGLVVLR
jgi:hypothetical protein